jgi:hypothetical protein
LDGMPDIGVPTDKLNADLRLWAPSEINDYKINEPISLAVEVVGREQVIFARDYGNRMFRYMDGDWLEVENVPTNWGEGQFLLSPSNGDPLEWGDTGVFPWFEGVDGPIRLRIIVVGHTYRDGAPTQEKVGAYVDVTLTK